MKQSILIISVLIVASSCNHKQENPEIWKKEIVDTEHAFAEMAKNEGIPKAFVTYAAVDAVLSRNNNLIKGRDEVKASLEKRFASGNSSLTWAPDFVDVSSSGDLGYTYGKYTFTSTDSLGNATVNEGIFHTVWKRQKDGTWKFVWD